MDMALNGCGICRQLYRRKGIATAMLRDYVKHVNRDLDGVVRACVCLCSLCLCVFVCDRVCVCPSVCVRASVSHLIRLESINLNEHPRKPVPHFPARAQRTRLLATPISKHSLILNVAKTALNHSMMCVRV